MPTKKIRRRKKRPIEIVSAIVVGFTVLASIALFIAVLYLEFVPEKYVMILAGLLVLFNLFFGFLGLSKRINNLNKGIQIFVCTVLSIVMITISVLVPQYKYKIENMFMGLQEVTELKINMYVLNSDERKEVTEYENALVGMHQSYDKEHLEAAVDDINKLIENNIEVSTYENMFDLVKALYAGDVEAILLNTAYVNIITENEEYSDFLTKTKVVYTITQEVANKHSSSFTGAVTKSPFIVLIGGQDSYNYDNISSAEGDWNPHGGNRTDVNMLAVVNPLTKQILLVTVPRDSYVPLMGNTDMMDKLTHSSVINVDTWEDCVEYIFDDEINVDFFVRVNFSTLVKAVDTIGGISIYNPYAFQSNPDEVYENGRLVKRSFWYPKGDIELNGNEALLYVRERKHLPDGDVSRNANQARVLKAIIKKVLSPEVITNAYELLGTMEGTFLTDMTYKQISALIKMQMNDMADWNIVTKGLYAEGPYYKYSYLLGYDAGVVIVDENTVEVAKEAIHKVLNGEIIEE